MKKETYYNLFKEYQALISQKQFNQFLCNRTKLDEVKQTLIPQLKKIMIQTAAEIVDTEKQAMRAGCRTYHSPLHDKLERLKNLYSKIEKEEPITEADYTDTFHKSIFLFGLTFPQFLLVTIISITATVLYKLFAT